MADIDLTAGNDVYVQPDANKNNWDNVFGEGGNDLIRLYKGTAIGGPGNDRFEKIANPATPGASFKSPTGRRRHLRVNLAEGWADDGYGGRDTLIGVRSIHGSGGRSDLFIGDAQDNYFWPQRRQRHFDRRRRQRRSSRQQLVRARTGRSLAQRPAGGPRHPGLCRRPHRHHQAARSAPASAID